MDTLQKGWLITGIYCGLAVVPGINAILGFMLAWALIIVAMPLGALTKFVLDQVWHAPPQWAVVGVAATIAILLVPVPTFVNAYMKAPPGQGLNALGQVAAMWLLAGGATWIAYRALSQAWRY